MVFLGHSPLLPASASRARSKTDWLWQQCRGYKLSGHSSNGFIGWQILKQLCYSLRGSMKLTLLRESTPERKWMQSHHTSCVSWIKWSSFIIYIYIRCLFRKQGNLGIFQPWGHGPYRFCQRDHCPFYLLLLHISSYPQRSSGGLIRTRHTSSYGDECLKLLMAP